MRKFIHNFEYHPFVWSFFSFFSWQSLAVPVYITLDSLDGKFSLIGISLLRARVYISIVHTHVVEIRSQQATKVCLLLWKFASLIPNTSPLAYFFSSVFVCLHLTILHEDSLLSTYSAFICVRLYNVKYNSI